MNRYFKDCETLEDVKAIFHKMAKELHPDNGGKAEEFKEMMEQYTKAFNHFKNIHKNHEGETYEKETDETPEEFAELIRILTGLEGCSVELVGSWIWVTGNTIAHKETLKANGLKWSANKKAWYYHEGSYRRRGKKIYSMDDIREMYNTKKFNKTEKRAIEA